MNRLPCIMPLDIKTCSLFDCEFHATPNYRTCCVFIRLTVSATHVERHRLLSMHSKNPVFTTDLMPRGGMAKLLRDDTWSSRLAVEACIAEARGKSSARFLLKLCSIPETACVHCTKGSYDYRELCSPSRNENPRLPNVIYRSAFCGQPPD